MIWVWVFFIANVIVLAGCIWVALSDAVKTGFCGTVGFSAIGLAAVGKLFNPVWMRHAIDGPEVLMLVGMAIVGLWVMGRKVCWMKRGRQHG
ncbi:holin [Pandoraea sputorum]|uniref:Holin n=1 Tax=Pandoraea sputorum TaxID=93222 RepID=A0A5E5BFV4_9BURK|nr:holin [Pandoraea sputorum]VVE85051.1 holin [Pandoraea sputorum]